jgi:PqqD family protein of HPr-rel-A system
VPPDPPLAASGLDVNAVDDGLVIYDPDQDRVHYLNNTAAAIFTLCDGERDAVAIAAAITALFGDGAVSPDDVDAFLAELTEQGLLRSGS